MSDDRTAGLIGFVMLVMIMLAHSCATQERDIEIRYKIESIDKQIKELNAKHIVCLPPEVANDY